jgi:transketolase
MNSKKTRELELFAQRIRLETVRALGHLGFGHIGGSMSIADVLAVLYGKELRHDPKQPTWPGRDWLILSKGHAGPPCTPRSDCADFSLWKI